MNEYNNRSGVCCTVLYFKLTNLKLKKKSFYEKLTQSDGFDTNRKKLFFKITCHVAQNYIVNI